VPLAFPLFSPLRQAEHKQSAFDFAGEKSVEMAEKSPF
jgi:hypothetical protein